MARGITQMAGLVWRGGPVECSLWSSSIECNADSGFGMVGAGRAAECSLWSNNIDAEGGQALAAALKDCTSLETLSCVLGTWLGGRGARARARAGMRDRGPDVIEGRTRASEGEGWDTRAKARAGMRERGPDARERR